MSRLTADELDDIKARNPLSDIAGGYVQLRRAGARLVGPCPVCGGKVTSQRFEVLPDNESWVCAVCPDGGDVIRLVEKAEGCDFRTAIERLGGRNTIDPAEAKRLFEAREKKWLAREKTATVYREAERKRLFKTWQKMDRIAGTLAARYMADRNCMIPDICPGLRFAPKMAYYHGQTIDERAGKTVPRIIHTGPVMAGAFIRSDGTFGGLHLTWLTVSEDGIVCKAEILDPDSGEVLNSKKMRGSKTGAHILVAKAKTEVPRRLFLGEGIETVDSVFTAFMEARRVADEDEFWAAGDLGNIGGRATETIPHPTLKTPGGRAQRVPGPMPDPDDSGLSIPESVEELILLGDGDSEKLLTECAMERAARRYAKEGRSIRIAFAPAGMDFNDVLQRNFGRDECKCETLESRETCERPCANSRLRPA